MISQLWYLPKGGKHWTAFKVLYRLNGQQSFRKRYRVKGKWRRSTLSIPGSIEGHRLATYDFCREQSWYKCEWREVSTDSKVSTDYSKRFNHA